MGEVKGAPGGTGQLPEPAIGSTMSETEPWVRALPTFPGKPNSVKLKTQELQPQTSPGLGVGDLLLIEVAPDSCA